MPDFVEGPAEGRRFRVYLQQRDTSCGPGSFRTAAYYLKGSAPTEGWIRDHSKRNMISPGILARIGALGLEARNQTAEIEQLVPLFRAFGLTAKGDVTSAINVQERIRAASRSRAFIVGVTWLAGGGHWVVVPYVSGNNIVVLDPGSGIERASAFPSYTPSYGSVGDFDGFIMEITA